MTLKHIKIKTKNMYVVNYAVLQDFNGNEWTFNNIEDFCVHVFIKKTFSWLTMPKVMYNVQFNVNWLVRSDFPQAQYYKCCKQSNIH